MTAKFFDSTAPDSAGKVFALIGNVLEPLIGHQPGLRRKDEQAGRHLHALYWYITGVGIAAGDQAKLFQAFEQLGVPVAHRHEGTGLGLHLSQKLAVLLGGRIEFDSQAGKGSRFTLVLEERRGDGSEQACHSIAKPAP